MQLHYYPKTIIALFLRLFTQNICAGQSPNQVSYRKRKLLTLSVFFLLAVQTVCAQAPVISSFSPASGAVGTGVTITGTAFNTTAANNIVFFGAARATVTAASATSLSVTVPTGATYAAITVLNTTTALAAYSRTFFLPTFAPSKSSVTNTDIAPGVDFAAGTSQQSVAMGDLDGDGKPDIVVANTGSNTISVLLNTSSAGSPGFAPKVDFTTAEGPYSVAIGDLDGDGKPDIVVSNGSLVSVSVLINKCSPGIVSFATALGFKTGSFPFSVAIGDVDGDGKADIVVANNGDNTVSVLRNTGSPGNIFFAAKVDLATGTSPWSVAIGDIDGDGKPDIVVANYSSATVSVLLNASSPGTISFAAKADFTTEAGPRSVAIGDIDGDGKPDLVMATVGSVSVLRNTASPGAVSFAALTSFAAGSNLWPVALGDINGDGKPDIIAGNIPSGSSTVLVLVNTGSAGVISFAAQTALPAVSPFAVAIGDMDGDGRPDIVVTNGSGFSVLRNSPVFTPSITSFTPASGPVGTLVTITGANLGSPTAFTIGGATAIVVSNTDTQLVGMVMPGATSGPANLTTAFGNTSGGRFTVTPGLIPAAQQGAKLVGTGAIGASQQGYSIALSADGNTAAVGGSADNNGVGAVWIYTRNGTTWTQQGAKLVGTGGVGGSEQGTSVAISADGNTVLEGASQDASGVGAAWVFTRSNGVWAQQGAKLPAGALVSNASVSPNMGTAVALSADGNTALVGAQQYTFFNSDTNGSDNTGAGALYTRSNGVWQQGTLLYTIGSASDLLQGSSVALSADGSTAIVGGYGVNSSHGAAWAYTQSGGVWQPGIELTPTDVVGVAWFGKSAALSADGNTAIIGGPNDNGPGAAWIFTRNGNTWAQQGSKLLGTPSNGNSAQMGESVTISADGNTAIAGEPAGNNGYGGAWVYTRIGTTWAKHANKLGDPNALSNQGTGVAISADGATAMVGGSFDNSYVGAAWAYVPASTDATLSNLALSSGTLSPAFAPGTNTYNVSVTNTTTSVTVTPTVNVVGSTVKVNGTAVTSGSASAAINLKAGANTISVVVTAQDGTTTDTYTLTVIRASVTAPNISYAGPQTYPAAVKITALSPTNSGGGVPAIAFSQTATFQKGTLSPVGVVVDASGNVFTTSGHLIWKIAPGGQPVVFAGSGADGHANGQGTAASFGSPTGLAIDAQGNLYTADSENNMIREITPQGLVSTFAGSGAAGMANGAGTVASFSTPVGVAVGPDGSVYVADADFKAIRKITPAGVVSTIAFSSATNASYTFSVGIGITVDGAGNIYVVDPAYFVVRKFTQTGAMSIVAGMSAKQGYADGPVATAQFYNPFGITLDAQNNLYVADTYGIREITTDGTVGTIAGYGAPGGPGTSVDGIGHAAIFQGGSRQLTADGKGKLYLAEISNSAIRTISYVGYAINNALPAGLTFNYLTGGITGTPTTISPAADYGITAYNLGGKSTANINIAVTANANLSALKLSKGTLSATFAEGTTNYSVMETNSTASITVTPTAVDPLATIAVNGTLVKSGSPSGAIALSVGANTIITKVTGQDGTTTESDTLTVTRPSTNAKLAALKVSSGTLTPAFNANTTNYTATVPYITTSINITPTVAVAGATVTVNGAAVTSDRSSAAVALSVGTNTISAVVTAQDGVTTDTYTITVTRPAPSANASLANIVVSKGTLSPAFATATGSYTDMVTNGTTSLTLTPTAADATASILVNGSPVVSGKASGAIALAIGSNTVNVVITAQNGTSSQSYTVTVIRPSTNAKLAGLVLSNGTLSPVFNSVTVTYKASVPYSVSTITVTPTVAITGATVKVNGTATPSGNASGAIALSVGANTITTLVTAQDGVTTDTYTVTVTRAVASANDNLSALTISKGTLSPAFATATTAYTDLVTNGTASVTITPTLADSTATITVNGTKAASGKASAAVALIVGTNPITVTVTAQSGVSKTYSVTVTRPSTNAKLAGLTVSSGTLTPAFNTNTNSYTSSVTNPTAFITVTPTVVVNGATVTVNGTAVAPGKASQAIALSVGSNTITTIVTAQDGVTTDTYTITVIRAAPGANNPDAEVGVQNFEPLPLLADDGISVHQGVSPNGDGINDFLQIDNIINYPDNKLTIMNRNGQLVFEAAGYDNANKVFDGHSNKNGQMQLPGTYFYSLDYMVKGLVKHKTGFLVLKY